MEPDRTERHARAAISVARRESLRRADAAPRARIATGADPYEELVMWSFRAMNTDVAVAVPGVDDDGERDLAVRVARLFADTEARFSRFRDDSELAVLNRAQEMITVSPALMQLLQSARAHVIESRGLFDPAVGTALRAAGYDRSFTPGSLDRPSPTRRPRRARFDELAIDERARRVGHPIDLQLDFGGFLKGRTVDHAAALLPTPSAVDAGGDAMLRGADWIVDIEDPFDATRTLLALRVRDRAVATSASNRRRWRVGGELAHHLIDPRTGAPSRSDLAQVTILAPTAEQADVHAKVVFLLGAGDGARHVEQHPELAAVLVTRTREVLRLGDLEVIDA